MGRSGWAATVAFLAFACGEQRGPPPPPPAPRKAATPKPKKAPAVKPPAVDPAAAKVRDEAQRTELGKKRTALVARIAELTRIQQETEARLEQERAGLPRIDTRVRRRFMQYVQDARTAEHKLHRMEQRFQELEKVAKSGLTGKLKKLTDQRDAIEKRRAEIENAWLRALDESHHGRVKESPVKKELYLVRAVKRQWFAVSGPARRGKLKSGDKWRILKTFRGWLDEVPARKSVVAKALAQPLAPKGKTPANYDYTDLEFYILLELLEDSLDRANIVLENKELKENRSKLEQIRRESDTVVQAIHDSMAEGGSELSEYLDLLDRLPTARENASYLSTRIVEWERIFREIGEIDARHAKENEEAHAALDKARRELDLVETELRRLG
jgi:hypothetical protein